jgi:hypothetical protein
LGLLRTDGGLVVEAPGFLRVELESATAVGANMVEAALGLAGVDDVVAAALWTADDLFQSLHTGILAITARNFRYLLGLGGARPFAVLDSRTGPAKMTPIPGVWSTPRAPLLA